MTASHVPAVVWHDAECGGYGADLGLWEDLAAATDGPVLDLGCGTGRVALALAQRGYEVLGVDIDPPLVDELNRRAEALPAQAVVGDARELALGQRFPLALAPMQLVQLLADEAERQACLTSIAAHLTPNGVAALAIVDDVEVDVAHLSPLGLQMRHDKDPEAPPPLPDTREVDGYLYSSLPLPTVLDGEAILVRRLRQTVTPGGRLLDEEHTVRLAQLGAAELEREGAIAGLEPFPRRQVPPTEDHVGSTVVLFRKEAS